MTMKELATNGHKTLMPDVMIDLETMGTRPDAPIIAIGAVAFDIDKGVLGERFYTTVDLASSVSQGARIDPGTVMWWLKQGDEARAALQDGSQAPVNIALQNLTLWLRTNCAPTNKLRPWGNGANFDPVILEEHYRKADLDVPWKFWNIRCCRTLAALRPDIKRQNNGTMHNALDDAIAQAEQIIAIFQSMIARERAIPDGWRIWREGSTVRIEHPSIGRAVTSGVSKDPNDMVLHHLAESLLAFDALPPSNA
ncbi:MAG: 3'-5' exoribonuclease [Burkholderiaceae bacterium]|nr:3'-5' exoribonuclease [Burkholderiaceae bacterium]